jgi:hypothetical protein
MLDKWEMLVLAEHATNKSMQARNGWQNAYSSSRLS